MIRRPYAAPASRLTTPISPDKIVAGWYLTKLARGGPDVTVRIWHDRPLDPVTMAPMDRSPRWQMELNGAYIDARGEPWSEDEILRTYIWAAKQPISPEEFSYRVARQQHAVTHDETMPEAAPRERIDLGKLPPLF